MSSLGGGGSGSGMQQQWGQGGGQSNPFAMRPPSRQPKGGIGGGIGNADGGNPLGAPHGVNGYRELGANDATNGKGKVIASWLQNGKVAKGDATVEFDQAIQQARDEGEKAVTEDRVPHRYDPAIKDYFDRLPQTPAQVTAPPPAPR
jgi:hypothetical protein